MSPNDQPSPSKKPIDEMVDRFLCWELPEDFSPDCGISFDRDFLKFRPVGTNLLTATQAKAMLEHVLGDEFLRQLASQQKPKSADRCETCGKPLRYCGNKIDGYYYGCFRTQCQRQRVSLHMKTKRAAFNQYHGLDV